MSVLNLASLAFIYPEAESYLRFRRAVIVLLINYSLTHGCKTVVLIGKISRSVFLLCLVCLCQKLKFDAVANVTCNEELMLTPRTGTRSLERLDASHCKQPFVRIKQNQLHEC